VTGHTRLAVMRACPSCGAENPDEARFCMACASPLAEPARSHEVRKSVTVVFCDVTGSTALGELLEPETLWRVMTRYFDTMRIAIRPGCDRWPMHAGREAITFGERTDYLLERGSSHRVLAEILLAKGAQDEGLTHLRAMLDLFERKGVLVALDGLRARIAELEAR
jgi:hypothetical protein